MPRHIPTWPHGNAESKRKIAVISAAFLSIRSTEACGIFGQTSAPSFTLVLEPWNFSLLYLLLIVSIIMFQGSMFYITQGCYSSCSEDEPQIWRFPVIRKSREASVRFLRPNPSPLARPWPSTLANSRMRTCLQNLVASSGYCRWWGLRIFS